MEAKNTNATEPAERVLVIERTFDAPRSLVFKAWTEPEGLMRWWGPNGFTTVSCKMDLRAGGGWRITMRSPEGREDRQRGVFREIVEPERIVFINSFADDKGNAVRNPWNADWPLEVLNTQTFAEHDGKTTLTLRGGPINASETERKTFEAGFESMQQGFTGTLDQLAEYLAANQRSA